MQKLPGDLGDSRLNNYFLENIYQWSIGNSRSLWHLGFFYPFPYTIGFSDNLFGSSPIYLALRSLQFEPFSAFQLWYLAGYLANYAAGWYALKKLGLSEAAATVGALIFAFALPVAAHSGHVQLHYRAGVPLALAFFCLFLKSYQWRFFAVSAMWCTWELYATIYIGFFTLFNLFTITVARIVLALLKGEQLWVPFAASLRAMSQRERLILVMQLSLCFFALVLLFYPYIAVSFLYGANRSWQEIAPLVPRLQSYVLSDVSLIWRSNAEIFDSLTMRWEHQMFFGIVPLLLGLIGWRSRYLYKGRLQDTVLGMGLILMVALTLMVSNMSAWYVFSKLPLASAIRALTRIDLVMLFTIAYFAAIGTEYLFKKRARAWWPLTTAVMLSLVAEFYLVSPPLSSKVDWESRLSKTQQLLPNDLDSIDVLFLANPEDPWHLVELDAMWVSLLSGVQTMNGYSGMPPPGINQSYSRDCAEIPKRLRSYIQWKGAAEENKFDELIRVVRPLGFVGCKGEWWQAQ